MKQTFKLIGITALIAVIGFSMATCGGGDDGGNPPTSITYTSYDASGNIYTLVVTKDPNRAVYVPQSGDTYVLTIKNSAGSVIGTSTGLVKTTSGSNFTLESGGVEFSVTISGNTISEITAESGIPIDDGDPIQPPVLTPNKPSGGTFTVTGIPSEYNGKYAGVQGGSQVAGVQVGPDIVDIAGGQSFDMSTMVLTLVPIANGSVILPMWTVNASDQIVRYTGNHTLQVQFGIFNSSTVDFSSSDDEPIASSDWDSVTFSSGSATRTWDSGRH